MACPILRLTGVQGAATTLFNRHEDLKSLLSNPAPPAVIMGAGGSETAALNQRQAPIPMTKQARDAADKVVKTDAEWRSALTPDEFYITRQHGTERPGSSPLNQEKRQGTFMCVCCGAPLFASSAKYESGSGWPSFDKPTDGDVVSEHQDRSHLMQRTEVRCARCEAHLGHVFPDGPPDTTGLRYCINGAALKFKPSET
jgi:peptide-methionine (R)-S-oxide reductase